MRRSIRNLLSRWPVVLLLWTIVAGDATYWIYAERSYTPLVTRVLPFSVKGLYAPHAHNMPRAIIVVDGSTVKLVERERYYQAMKDGEKAFEVVGEVFFFPRRTREGLFAPAFTRDSLLIDTAWSGARPASWADVDAEIVAFFSTSGIQTYPEPWPTFAAQIRSAGSGFAAAGNWETGFTQVNPGAIVHDCVIVLVLLVALVATPFSIRGAIKDYRSARRRERLGAGKCPRCLYDISASRGKCPECGEDIR